MHDVLLAVSKQDFCGSNLEPKLQVVQAVGPTCVLALTGGQWQKAAEMFQQMQRQGLTPDVVTYTAIISAYEKGGQWRLALSGYEQMRERGCRPDAIVFNAIIDALWETGVIWAQRKVSSSLSGCLSKENTERCS